MRVEVLFVNEAGVTAGTVEAPDGAAASEVLGLAGAGASPRLRSSLQPACVRHGKCRKGALADNLRANPLLQW